MTGTTTEETVTTSLSTESADEVVTEDMSYVCELPELNYNGEEVNFMYVKVAGRDDELISEKLGTSVR